MSKLKEHLTEANNLNNIPKDQVAKEVDGAMEDILFQLEVMADMDAVHFNVSKKLRKTISDLRKVGMEVSKSIRKGV